MKHQKELSLLLEANEEAHEQRRVLLNKLLNGLLMILACAGTEGPFDSTVTSSRNSVFFPPLS